MKHRKDVSREHYDKLLTEFRDYFTLKFVKFNLRETRRVKIDEFKFRISFKYISNASGYIIFSCDAISNYFAIIKIEIYIYKDGFIY